MIKAKHTFTYTFISLLKISHTVNALLKLNNTPQCKKENITTIEIYAFFTEKSIAKHIFLNIFV